MRTTLHVALLLFLSSAAGFAQSWRQWGADPQHMSRTPVFGQTLDRNLADVIYDEAAAEEIAKNEELLVHYQAPLVDDSGVYMMTRAGHFDRTTFASKTWGEKKWVWSGATLVSQWQFTSDWKPPGSLVDFFEPVFHPALANGALYVPGAGGSIFRVDKQSGAAARINPFTSLDQNVYVASPLTVDTAGNILYNAVAVMPGSFYAADVIDSWLVRVSPSNAVEKVSYQTLTAGTPRGNDLCTTTFNIEPLPWPPSINSVPASAVCGTQRPGLNAAPAVAPDGTIYVLTRAHFNSRWAYLIAITPELAQKWIATLRDRFLDGCGVPVSSGGTLPPNGSDGGCRLGSLLGVDPTTNTPGGGRVSDSSSASPVVAPDGSVFYGALTRYNYAQGHLMHFSPAGAFLGAYRFGWDITPGVYAHDGGYSVVIKENRYPVGSYCGLPGVCGVDRSTSNPASPEGYFVTQLNSDLRVEWQYQNTNRQSCSRQLDGSIQCADTHPNSFEWCVNAFVVDATGVVYANSEDGWLYAIAQGGVLRSRIFQQLALGAAYTPTAMDSIGRVYSQNAGHMFVAGGVRRRAVAHK